MHAKLGDRIVVQSRRVGMPERIGSIVEVRGPDGQPPYVVCWFDRPGEHLFFPGADATVRRDVEDSPSL